MATDRYKILIVDDEEEICDYMQEKLQKEFDVTTANTGEEGISLFTQSKFDVYIFDLRLSTSITGIDMIRKCIALYPEAKIIAMTGYVDNRLKQEAVDAGVSDYAEKPAQIQPDVIYGKVKALLKS